MEEVITSILVMPVLSDVMHLLDRRLVSLLLRGLVVLGDKLLHLLLRLTNKKFNFRLFESYIIACVPVLFVKLFLFCFENHFPQNLWSFC